MKLGEVSVGAEVKLGSLTKGDYQSIGTIFNTGIDLVDSVQIDIGLFRLIQIRVNLSPPLEKALEILKSGRVGLGFTRAVSSTGEPATTADAPPQQGKTQEEAKPTSLGIQPNGIAVRITNGGVSSSWYKGLLLNPDLSLDLSEIRISLQAQGILFDDKESYVKGAFKGQSRVELVKSLYGDGQKHKVQISEAAKAAMDALPVNDSPAGSENQIEYAATLVKEAGCMAVNKGAASPNALEEIRISTVEEMRKKAGTSEGAGAGCKTFVLYKQFDPSQGIYPIQSFETPIQRLMFPDAPCSSIQTKSMDSSRKVKTDKIGSSSYSRDRSAVATSPNGTLPADPNAPRSMPVPYREESSIKERLSQAVHSAIDRVFEYDIETIGVFDLVPGDPVRIEVADIEFLTGLFEVTQVTHSLGRDGASTKFKCFRTGGFVKAVSKGVGHALAVAKQAVTEQKTLKKSQKQGVAGD